MAAMTAVALTGNVANGTNSTLLTICDISAHFLL
jgi:hypothetical protein